MYRSFYNLKVKPFHITPDPEFLFLSPSHREAFASIIYGIDHRKGFLAIIGEVGVGKTTVLRTYLEKTEHEQHRIIYVFNAALSFSRLLELILSEFGVEAGEDDEFVMVNRLHHLLIEEYKSNRNVILIIDEAQNMPISTLESLRMLSNLETSEDKLIQILLVGQPELERTLNLNELRQLRQRIAFRCRINPLTEAESYAYIQHRLAKASALGEMIFAQGSLKPIIKEARGIPRVINILCDNALVTGFGCQKRPISKKIVKEIIAEYVGEKHKRHTRWWLAPATAVILAIAFLFSHSVYWAPVERQRDAVKLQGGEPVGGPAYHSPADYATNLTANLVNAATETMHVLPTPQPPLNSYPVAWVATQMMDKVPPHLEQPIQVPIPATTMSEEQGSASAKKDEPVIRTVKGGDCILNLIRAVYGYVDDGLIAAVRESNPQIKDINIIQRGDRIVFPRMGN